MTSRPIFYSFRRCPYAMRARMAIAVSGLKVELREVVLRDKPPELIAVSPKATVPVLILPDSTIIDESMDIMRWALGQNDPENWLNGGQEGLIEQNDGQFKAALDRYKYPNRYGLTDITPYRSNGLEILAALDNNLANSRFLGGESQSLADIAIFPFVRQFAATDQIWFGTLPLPGLHRWLGDLLASNLFASIMARYPPWRPTDVPIIFP